MAAKLRHETFKELAEHCDDYYNHQVFTDIEINHSLPKRVVMHAILGQDAIHVGGEGDMAQSFRFDVDSTKKLGRWASVHHLFALSTILQCPIVSVFPDVQTPYRQLFHRVITPLRIMKSSFQKPDTNPRVIWSRSGSFDINAPFYEPNHVVPLLLNGNKPSVPEPSFEPINSKKRPKIPESNKGKSFDPKQRKLFDFGGFKRDVSGTETQKKSTGTEQEMFTPDSATCTDIPEPVCDEVEAEREFSDTATCTDEQESVYDADTDCEEYNKSSGPRRKIQSFWFRDYPWLQYKDRKFYCTTCISGKVSNVFAQGKDDDIPKKDDFSKHPNITPQEKK